MNRYGLRVLLSIGSALGTFTLLATESPKTVKTSSPQGIEENIEERRAAVNRSDRQEFVELLQGNRPIRTYDGSNNNRRHPEWGATFAQLQRLAPANYTDGVSSMSGGQVKSAREISNILAHQEDGLQMPNRFNTSDYLWQWGQFIDHDLGLTDGSTQESENIEVPIGDNYFDPQSSGTIEIPFNRAIYDPETGTSRRNPRQQENEITSWIDGSMIYGSDEARAAALRVGPDSPFLATSDGQLLPFNEQQLVNANGFVSDPTLLFLAGDVRANEQVGLTAMHTLWVREHNRIAADILANSPQVSPEAIFQQARRLVIAEIQIITYNEYLPALLGPNTMPPYQGYRPNVNPTIYNEFSAAAYRIGHSEVSDSILMIEGNNNVSESGSLSLREAFFQGYTLFSDYDDVDPVLRGLAKQQHQAIDVQVISDLRNFLFGEPGRGGFDLVALNIQRGRDHGLNTYNETRRAMGLRPARRFADVNRDPAMQSRLASAYDDVNNIELWVGGLAESPYRGSQLGELFTAINVKQFDALRAGDRFWYQHYLTPDERKQVENITLAKVIRANTQIGDELQDNVFYIE